MISRLMQWLRSESKKEEENKEPEKEKKPIEVWAAVRGSYEKWRHPANKNDKHYRIIFRNNKGQRRISKVKFKRASEALEYIDRFNQACQMRLEKY